jgi:hypothetical protein
MKQSRQYLIGIVLILVLICAGIFVSLKKNDELQPNQQIVEIEIADLKMVSPKSPIVIEKGKSVQLRIQTDENEEFHLEGYHAFTKLKPDRVMLLDFEALTEGRFSMYLDRSKTHIGIIEVVES